MPATSSSNIYRYIKEATPGTTPSGNPQIMRVLSDSVNQSIETIENNELRSDRGRSDTTLVAGSVGGAMNFDLSHKTFDDFLESLLADDYVIAAAGGVKTVADLVLTSGTNVITSAATNLPLLEKGQWFRVTGAALAGNNGIYKASSSIAPTTASITVDTAVKAVAGTSTALSCIVSTSRLKQANDLPLDSYTIEREHSDVTQFFTWKGMYVSSLNLAFSDKAAVTGNFGFMAKSPEVLAAVTGFPSGTGSAVAATTTSRFNSVTGTTVLIDGVTMGESCVSSFTLDIAANTREIRCLGSGLSAAAIVADQFTITGQANIFFGTATSATLYGKKLTDLPISFSICVTDAAGNGFAVTIPRGKITEASVTGGAIGSDVMMSFNFTASTAIATDPVPGTMIMIDRIGSIV